MINQNIRRISPVLHLFYSPSFCLEIDNWLSEGPLSVEQEKNKERERERESETGRMPRSKLRRGDSVHCNSPPIYYLILRLHPVGPSTFLKLLLSTLCFANYPKFSSFSHRVALVEEPFCQLLPTVLCKWWWCII